MSIFEIDCELPSPHISGPWRPTGCTSNTALILMMETVVNYICDNISPPSEGMNNNLRIVPGGTASGAFNAEFYLATPADDAIVIEGNNVWWSVDNGANWDILEQSSFQIGTAGSFADPDNPTPAELRALFPQSLPANNALVFNTYNDAFYNSDDAGVTWGEVDYVKTTGDTMTGPLIIDITEVDLAADLDELTVLGTHVLTANNAVSVLTGIVSTQALNTGAFDSLGALGVDVTVSHDGDAGSVVDSLTVINSRIDKFGGASVVTNATGIQISSTNTSTGTITNLYGLNIGNQAGGVTNHAIMTGSGLNQFGDQVKIVGNQDVTQLWVVGDNAQTNPIVQIDDSASTPMFYLLADGEINILPKDTAGSGGGTPLYIQTPARTAMTASTEQVGVWIDSTATKQWATGALTTQREVLFERPTYAFVGASTITNAATVYIENAPAQGTNATITNAYALWVDDGAVRLDGNLGLNGNQPTAQSTGWAVTNPNTRKTFDTTTVTLPQLAEVVGTIIDYLILRGDFSA